MRVGIVYLAAADDENWLIADLPCEDQRASSLDVGEFRGAHGRVDWQNGIVSSHNCERERCVEIVLRKVDHELTELGDLSGDAVHNIRRLHVELNFCRSFNSIYNLILSKYSCHSMLTSQLMVHEKSVLITSVSHVQVHVAPRAAAISYYAVSGLHHHF
jgi:hypothetical protein